MSESPRSLHQLQNTLAALFLLLVFAIAVSAQQAAPAPITSRGYETRVRQEPIDNKIADDKGVAAMIVPYAAELKDKLNTVIGHTAKIINKEGPAAGALGRLVAEIIRQTAADKTGRKIDIALMNNGGLRAEIPAGQITIGTIYQLMPFDNNVAIFELTGADLQELFQAMAGNIVGYGNAVIGPQLVYREGKLISAKINEQPIDPRATYTIATIDYLYQREEPVLARGKNFLSTGVLLRDAIINYIRAQQEAGRPLQPPATVWVTVE
ncbi:MAG: 5'-nucleotidase C-terminal domain-containing protein [Acidobacteriota bacterium]